MNLGTFIAKLQNIENDEEFCAADVYFTTIDNKPCLIVQGTSDMYCFNLLQLKEGTL